MKLENGKIILNEEENKIFEKHLEIGIYHQLHKEKLLTDVQLNQLLKSIDE